MFTLSLSQMIIVSGITIAAATMGFKMIFKRKKELHLKNKNDSKIIYPELSNLNWVKVGNVKTLNIYPIGFGAEISYHRCKFTQYGMYTEEKAMAITNGMFLVLDIASGKFQDFRNYESLRNISISILDSFKVQFNAPGMPAFVFEIYEQTKKIFLGATWHDDSSVMECFDCGEAASIWINNFLQSTNLRLVRMNYKPDKHTIETDIIKKKWSPYVIAQRNGHYSGIFTDLARFVLITNSTLEQLNKEKKLSNVYPNIVVSTPSFPPYAEKKWQWLKIGNTILRQVEPNLRQVPRYLPVYFGDSLKRYAFSPISSDFGIRYEMYVAGDIRISNEIYVHFPKEDFPEDIETVDCQYSF